MRSQNTLTSNYGRPPAPPGDRQAGERGKVSLRLIAEAWRGGSLEPVRERADADFFNGSLALRADPAQRANLRRQLTRLGRGYDI